MHVSWSIIFPTDRLQKIKPVQQRGAIRTMNSLFMRIFLFFSCLMLAAGAILGITMYRASAQLVEQSMGMQAQAVAERAAALIDTSLYAPLSTGKDKTAYYDTLREQLSQS